MLWLWSSDCMCVFLRWTYQEFFSRYRVLMKQKDVLPDKKLTCRNVLEKLVQVRLSKFFIFRLKNTKKIYFIYMINSLCLTCEFCSYHSTGQGQIPIW